MSKSAATQEGTVECACSEDCKVTRWTSACCDQETKTKDYHYRTIINQPVDHRD